MACSDLATPGPVHVRIAFTTKAASNSFFDVSRSAALLAGRELRAAGQQVEVDIRDPELQTADAQIAAVAVATEAGYDAIAISVVDPVKVAPAIDNAVRNGVGVITFDSDAPTTRRTTYYGANNLAGAAELADALASLLQEEGKIAIMTAAQDSASTVYTERMQGFEQRLALHPGLLLVARTYCTQEIEQTTNGCVDLLEATTRDHPEVTGWYLARGRVLRESNLAGLAPTWASAVQAGRIRVVGFDAPADALDSIRAGYASLVLSQKYFSWGFEVVHLAVDLIARGRRFGAFTNSDFDRVCQSNVEEYAAMWQVQDFRTPLRPCQRNSK